jgi:prepilin-type processing-associated H-X9-DG protein
MKIRLFASLGALLVLLAMARPTVAQPLVEHVPGDAVLYVGWQGADALGESYDSSRLKRVVEASQLAEVFEQMIPQAIERLREEAPQEIAITETYHKLLAKLWRYPTAVYSRGIDATTKELDLGLIVMAGEDAQAFSQSLLPIFADLPKPPEIRVDKGLVIVLANTDSVLDGQAKLAQNESFIKAMAKVEANPALAAYAEVGGLLSSIEVSLRDTAPPSAQFDPVGVFNTLRAELGLNQFKQAAFSAGFAEGDWETHTFFAIDGPRKGLLFTESSDATAGHLIEAIPQNAAMAGAFSFNIEDLYEKIRLGAGKLDPQLGQQVNMSLAMVDAMLGQNIGRQILAPLGSQWAYYTDANVGGTGMLGIVAMNDLKDPPAANQALMRLGTTLTTMAGQSLRDAPTPMTLDMREVQYEGTTIHYLAIPAIAPSWTIHQGRLYMGLQPQTVAAAIDFAKSEAPNLSSNPAFAQQIKTLAEEATPESFNWIDMPQKLNDSYQINLVMARYMTGMADMFGVQAPPLMLPPMTKLSPHMAPALSVSWSDDDGQHYRNRSPFPMSSMFTTQQNLYVAQASLMAGILLPSLGRAREVANRTVCSANLIGIHKAMYTYSITHQNRFPNHLGELMMAGKIGPQSLTCPSGAGPSEPLPPNNIDWPGWIDRNSDYIYVGRGKTAAAAADDVLMYEKMHNHSQGEGVNIMFGDGHVEFLLMEDALYYLREAGINP